MSQKEIRHFFTIRNSESVNGEMFLEGISDPGAPNKRGLMLDAETSWPYIDAYVKEFEERTGGASKGALRAMHDERREVGKVVEVDLSQAPAIPVRVHVVSEEAKRFVEERVLNAFSWNWAVVGQMWEDKAASKQFGRKVMKYTGRPIELSLVDAPGIPDTGFNVVANFDEGEEMSEPAENPTEPVAEPAPAPVEPEVVANSDPHPETVANGLYTVGRFGEALEGLAYIQRVISGEEHAEGEANSIPDDLKAAISEVAKVYATYATKQAAELIDTGKDFDAFDVEDEIENGDTAKQNPFAMAHKASVKAHASEANADHEEAAIRHKKAAVAGEKAGKAKMAKYHRAQQKIHSDIANCAKVGNSDTAPAPESSAVLEALSALSARFDALEAKVANSDHAPAAPVAPAPIKPKPVAVFHDPDQGGATVRNSDIPDGLSLLERAEYRRTHNI